MPFADIIALELIAYLTKLKEVERVDILGSLRRKVATIGDIDLSIVTRDPKKVIAHFVQYPKVRKITDQGEKGATVLLSIGRQVDLRVQDPASYGAMLQYFTGSKHHNIKLREFALRKGLSLSEHGIKSVNKNAKLHMPNGKFNSKKGLYEFKTEEAFYNAIGLDWMPPEMREDAGEIEAALRQAQGKPSGLPKLVELKNIKGDLHIHSSYDLEPSHDLGANSLEELLNEAANLNYSYIGLSDHNPSVGNHSQKEIMSIMKKRQETLRKRHTAWQKKTGKKVELFILLETDIQPSGELALPDAAFEFLDGTLVSIHSSFTMSKADMTQRILSGLSHPKAKIFAHPTARLLGERAGIDADWNNIFEFALKNNKALEINSWPQRLDLPDLLVRQAIKKGIKLVIDTDAHATREMNNMQYGIDVARRGWCEAKDILNTLEYTMLKQWLMDK
jgi:DNA polymerase (family 10)